MVRGNMLVCDGCGAVTPIGESGSVMLFKTAGEIGIVLLGLSLFAILALTIWPFQNKYTFSGMSNEQAHALVVECKQEERQLCVENGYRYLVSRNPNSKIYLANYAYALTDSGNFEKANGIYQEMLENGGATYDLFAYYARNRKGLRDIEGAIHWYENSLSVEPNTIDVTSELASVYLAQGRLWEAASLLDSFIRRHPNSLGYLKANLVLAESKIASRQTGKVESITLKSTDGTQFTVPVRFGRDQRAEMFVVDTGATLVMMPTGDFEKIPTDAKRALGQATSQIADSSSVNINLAKLDDLWLGPWELHDVEVGYCDTCQRLAGMSALTRITFSHEATGHLFSLSMHLAPNAE